jgi:hypothetical protein
MADVAFDGRVRPITLSAVTTILSFMAPPSFRHSSFRPRRHELDVTKDEGLRTTKDEGRTKN